LAHLQSYFLLFHKAAIKHRAFQRFWRSYPDVNDKTWVVLNGELGLSKGLVNAELRLAAAYPCKDAEARLRNTEHDRSLHIDFAAFLIGFRGRASELNPTRYYWETLIKRECFPFLKRHIVSGDSRFAFGARIAKDQPDKPAIGRHIELDFTKTEPRTKQDVLNTLADIVFKANDAVQELEAQLSTTTDWLKPQVRKCVATPAHADA
jgi:hypothetical protein